MESPGPRGSNRLMVSLETAFVMNSILVMCPWCWRMVRQPGAETERTEGMQHMETAGCCKMEAVLILKACGSLPDSKSVL